VTVALLSLLGGVALLYVGGEALVGGAARLALRTGLPPLAVGLTVVAFGTSSPELAVSVQSALGGLGDVAIGNVVGSNICNLALILGVAALIRPMTVHARVVRIDVPIMLAVSALVPVVLFDGRVSRLEGALLVAGIVAYTWLNLRHASRDPEATTPEDLGPGTRGTGSTGKDLLWIAVGIVGLMLGADRFVAGAITLADAAGLSQAFIALTVVALGTSLPELTTSVVAALHGEEDIAVGNVVGSNVFNVLAILGASAIARPLVAVGVGTRGLAVMIGVSVLVLPLLSTGSRRSRWEGALLLAVWLTYVIVRL